MGQSFQAIQTIKDTSAVGYDKFTDGLAIGILASCIIGIPIMLWGVRQDIKDEATTLWKNRKPIAKGALIMAGTAGTILTICTALQKLGVDP